MSPTKKSRRTNRGYSPDNRKGANSSLILRNEDLVPVSSEFKNFIKSVKNERK